MTGVVVWNEKGEALRFYEFNEDQLDEFLDLIEAWPDKPIIMCIEEYRVYASVNHIGSKVKTIQVIGSIKRTARKVRCKAVEIRADSKGVAARWSGVKPPRGHMPHWMAAYLIGYFHLHSIGIIPARVLSDRPSIRQSEDSLRSPEKRKD